MEAGLNSDPGNDSFSDKIRYAKDVDRSTYYSTCRSTQVKSASTDLWPQEMFTFSEMLALFRVGIRKQFRGSVPTSVIGGLGAPWRPAILLSGLETVHPAAAGPSPAYDFSVFDERNAVFLVSVLDCFGCFSSGLDHLNSSWSIARPREHFRRKVGHSGTGRKPSFVSGKCPYIVTSHSTHRVPPVSLWLFKVRFFGFWFGLSKLKLEHRLSERVLEEKRGHSRLLLKKAEPLERQVSLSRHLTYTLRCVYIPGAFPSATWNQQKKSLLAQTSPALQPLPLPFCQLPIVSGHSNWPRRRRGETYRFPFVYVLRTLTWDPVRLKRKHRWHCICFREVSSLTRFQRTGDGRVHRLLGTSMKAKIFCREDVLNAYDRVVGDAEVPPVSLTNGK